VEVRFAKYCMNNIIGGTDNKYLISVSGLGGWVDIIVGGNKVS
jgi:hypothetical protein